jgi:hypothetical protein
MSDHAFDRLARAAARTDDRPVSRRTAVKLGAVAVALAAPFGAAPAVSRAAGRRRDQGGQGQLPLEACQECQDRWKRWTLRNFVRCSGLPVGWAQFGCHQQVFWTNHLGRINEGCWGGCENKNPPEPVPQPPISSQPPAPPPPQGTSDDCLNCMSVGGTCCPPSGPLCACAAPGYPCSRYGC